MQKFIHRTAQSHPSSAFIFLTHAQLKPLAKSHLGSNSSPYERGPALQESSKLLSLLTSFFLAQLPCFASPPVLSFQVAEYFLPCIFFIWSFSYDFFIFLVQNLPFDAQNPSCFCLWLWRHSLWKPNCFHGVFSMISHLSSKTPPRMDQCFYTRVITAFY